MTTKSTRQNPAMTRANDILTRVLDACPEAAAYKAAADGSESRFAGTLIRHLQSAGAECEQRLSDADFLERTKSGANHEVPRAVFKMPDGPYVVVFDRIARIAQDKAGLLRFAASGHVEDAWNRDLQTGVDLARQVTRVLTDYGKGVFNEEIAQSLLVPTHSPASEYKGPLPKGAQVMAVDKDGDAVVYLEGKTMTVPGSFEKLQEELRENEEVHRMLVESGVPAAEIEEELSWQLKPLREAMKAYANPDMATAKAVLNKPMPH